MAVSEKKSYTTPRKPKAAEFNPLQFGRVPPQAPELEAAVLGAIMLEKEKLGDVREIIQSSECFYVDAHQKIYAAILRLEEKGYPIDILTVTTNLREANELELVGGAYYVTQLTRDVVTAANVETHARLIMERFVKRELIRQAGETLVAAYEEGTDVFDLLDKVESNLYEITDKHLRKNFQSLKDVLVRTIEEIEEARKKTDAVSGVPTGFTALNRITGGWQRTDLIILAARPAVGKTAFALNLAMNAAMNAEKPFPVAVFSLEMGAGQIVKRMLSCVTEVGMESITKGRMPEHEMVQLVQRMDKLAKAPIFLDDQAALNIFELRTKARRLKQKHDIQMILIDYLQLMSANVEGKGGNREQEISKISRDLKALAKELDIPIIALSQLNRSVESRKESKMPQLSDLRESGAIEQDADMVIFLYRPDYYGINNDEMGQPIEGETFVNIAKHRNGETAVEKVRFIKHFQKFVDFEESFDGGSFNRGGAPGDNPSAGIRGRGGPATAPDESEFSGSKLYVQGGYTTMPSKANSYNFDEEDDFNSGARLPKPRQDDGEDAPF